MAGESNPELDRPRSVSELLVAAFQLYRRLPILFLALAAVVVVPYELIVLAVTGAGPFAQGHLDFITSKGLLVLDSFLVSPLISAFHAHAVREVGGGGRPRLAATVRQALPRLPVVALAAGISGIATVLGTLAFLVPGLLLTAIWPVVAQVAALEPVSWSGALRRSINLTRGNRWHAVGLVLCAGLIAGTPFILLGLAFGLKATSAASFLVGTALQVILRSFEALATALLYFDLTARFSDRNSEPVAPAPAIRPTLSDRAVEPAGHMLDFTSWSDEDRPPGWYVDPSSPNRMRYWGADGTQSWSERTAKTPKRTLAEWKRRGEQR